MAMARKPKMREVTRDAKNDHLRSRYATLNGMLANPSCQPRLATASTSASISAGHQSTRMAIVLFPGIVSLGDHVETTSLEGPVVIAGAAGGRTQMTGIQATGSTTTYLKRYLLGMVFSLVLTDEQDDDGEASRQRVATPPSRPPVREAEPRQTVGAWLDALALELAACEGAEEVDAVLARSDVQAAQDRLQNGAADRLRGMLQTAIARTAEADTTAPNDGLYANPADDPFREPVPS